MNNDDKLVQPTEDSSEIRERCKCPTPVYRWDWDLCSNCGHLIDARERGKSRPETGPMQFEGDWPGVFVRGDNALHYAFHLEVALKRMLLTLPPLTYVSLRGLADLLKSCDARKGIANLQTATVSVPSTKPPSPAAGLADPSAETETGTPSKDNS
jgi:hypothetical protein